MSVTQNSINANATTPLPAIEGGSGVSSPTAHGILVAEGSSAFASKVLTNGQLLVGSTGADPVAASIGAGTNIVVTPGAGTVSVATSLTPNFSSVEVNNGTNNITIQPPASGLTNTTYTLPVAAPGTNGYLLSSTTAGVMSWSSPTAGSGASSCVIQIFSTSGTYTPTSNMLFCIVEALGGGGAGGGTAVTDSTHTAAGGGGGTGGYSRKQFSAATIGANQTVTIGGAGAGASGAAGGSGGNTTFGALLTANGGAGGALGTNGGILQPGGGGGSASGGTINVTGNTGTIGYTINGAGSYTFCFSGQGADNPYGAGGTSKSPTANGAAATGSGSGGGGAAAGISASALTGGNGAAGLVIVTEYIS